jgi:hypothetical protein
MAGAAVAAKTAPAATRPSASFLIILLLNECSVRPFCKENAEGKIMVPDFCVAAGACKIDGTVSSESGTETLTPKGRRFSPAPLDASKSGVR